MVCSVKIDSSCKGVLTDRQTSRPACRRCRLDGRAPRPPRGMPYSRELRLSPLRGESRGRADTRKRAHRTHTRTKSTRDTSRTPTYIKCSSHAEAPPVPHRGTPHPWPHRLRPSRTPGSDQVVVVVGLSLYPPVHARSVSRVGLRDQIIQHFTLDVRLEYLLAPAGREESPECHLVRVRHGHAEADSMAAQMHNGTW